jgi:periplasmic divalent cation tolerance protein
LLCCAVQTKSSLIPDVTKEIKDIHSYSVPEVIAVEINGGNQDYLSWVLKETKRKEVEKDGNKNDN